MVLLGVCAAITLAVVFTFAVVGKATANGFAEFQHGVRALWPGRSPRFSLSRAAERAIAVTVLAAEAATAVALLLTLIAPGAARPAFAAAAALLTVFVAAQAATLARGEKNAPCACFGRSATPVGPVTLARDAALLAVALLGLLAPPPDGSAMEIVAALAGFVLGLLVVAVEDIVALFSPGFARRD
ncbi:hypothetical protein J5X84_19765 [Streptosporangiaceae bacterium NEAU-GS5]|nr:hypothetical protein [Streptosporangiaceae bacterium NEAU-GS5]